MTAFRNHGYFEGVGRIRLQYRSTEVSNARAALLLVHGLSDHSGRYQEFCAAMADFGFSTFALDLRGHGHSEGRRGHVRRFDIFLQDLERFRREIQGLAPPGRPLFLLGQSMGGLIVLRYLEEYDAGGFSGAVLTSPWLGTSVQVPRWKVNMAHALSRVLPALPLSAGIPAELLSHDPRVADAYRQDPLVHNRITPRLYTESAEAMRLASERSDRVSIPLLFLLGGDDRIVDTPRAVALARSLRIGDVAIRVYPGQYHELFNEADRDLVLQDLREWLGRHMERPAAIRP